MVDALRCALVNHERKLELLDQRIAEANGGSPADFSLWQQRTEVVLRNVVGDASPLYSSFQDISYTLSMFSVRTPQSAWVEQQQSGVRQAIAILEAAKTEVELSGGLPEPAAGTHPSGSSVFIVHGHDDAKKHEVARFLRKLTGNEPVILHEQANGGRTIIEKFEEHAADAGYAVVIATGDDLGRAVPDDALLPRARQNVIFELGFFFGILGRSRVALLYTEGLDRPSDIDGVVRIALDEGGAWKMLLAREISGAGIGVVWSALGS